MDFSAMKKKKDTHKFEIRLSVNNQTEWEFRYPIQLGLLRQIQSQSGNMIHNPTSTVINWRFNGRWMKGNK